MSLCFAKLGPNVTTLVIPAEVFSARVRWSCDGIWAAAGKAGAMVGAFRFVYGAQRPVEGKQEKGHRIEEVVVGVVCDRRCGIVVQLCGA